MTELQLLDAIDDAEHELRAARRWWGFVWATMTVLILAPPLSAWISGHFEALYGWGVLAFAVVFGPLALIEIDTPSISQSKRDLRRAQRAHRDHCLGQS